MSEGNPPKGLFDDVPPGLPGRPLEKVSERKASKRKASKRKGGVARLQAMVLASGAMAVSLGREHRSGTGEEDNG